MGTALSVAVTASTWDRRIATPSARRRILRFPPHPSHNAARSDAAASFEGPFITKHNRAGKGLGVRLFQDLDELRAYLDDAAFEAPVDGITLIQDYIQAPEPFITRVEFVGGELLYAVRVDTSDGFELCPAEACALPGATRPKFEVIEDFDHPLVPLYRDFLAQNGIEVAGIEFIVDATDLASGISVRGADESVPDSALDDFRSRLAVIDESREEDERGDESSPNGNSTQPTKQKPKKDQKPKAEVRPDEETSAEPEAVVPEPEPEEEPDNE